MANVKSKSGKFVRWHQTGGFTEQSPSSGRYGATATLFAWYLAFAGWLLTAIAVGASVRFDFFGRSARSPVPPRAESEQPSRETPRHTPDGDAQSLRLGSNRLQLWQFLADRGIVEQNWPRPAENERSWAKGPSASSSLKPITATSAEMSVNAEEEMESEISAQQLHAANRKLRLVVDTANDAFVGMDPSGRITDWNRQAEAIFGWRYEDVARCGLVDTIIPLAHREVHRAGLARFLASGKSEIHSQRVEITAQHRDGREFPVELSVWAVDGGTDTPSFYAFVHDTSERRAYEDALRESETSHRRLADQLATAQHIAGLGTWEWDIVADTISWSDELCRLFGVEPGRHPSSYEDYLARVHPDHRARVDAAIRHAFVTGQPFSFDHRVAIADNELRIVNSRGDVTLNEAGIAVRMTGTAHDVTEREMTANALRRSERRLAEAQRIARLGSWEWDIAANAVSWSDELCRLFGDDLTEAGPDSANFIASYQGYLDHVHPDDRALAESALAVALETRDAFAFDHRVVRSDGTIAWFQSRVEVEVGADGVPTRMSGTAADITERIELEQELAALALFDELTGLHNRRGFVILADHQLKVACRAGRPVPMLFVDMDGMKTINDTYGHDEGNRALIEVATFLRTTVRASDLVARVGGDEFCILLVDDASSTGKIDVDRVLAELRAGRRRGPRPYPLPLSVGVAWLEPGSATSVEDLMNRADGAMYEDKSSQRRRPRVLVVEDDAGLRRLAELALRISYDVITAATGGAALEVAADGLPDLVLLDLNLPDMHGAEVLRRLRGAPGGDRVPVIVITAAGGRTAELESLQEGVDDFVVKPLDLDILEARMRNVLRRSSSRPRRLGA